MINFKVLNLYLGKIANL